MKMHNLLLAIALLLTGCAADRQARTLAVHATQDIVTYEDAVDAKVAAEKAFYQNQLTRIRAGLGGNSAITSPGSEQKASNDLTQEERIKRTLPYGRIITHAEHDARVTADRIITAPGVPGAMEAIMTYIGSGLDEEQSEYLDLIARQRQLAYSFNSTLTAIDEQKQKLAAVRDSLASLAAPPNASAQLQELIAFGKGVQSQLNQTNSPPK